jgi:L-lactate dehydrogenase
VPPCPPRIAIIGAGHVGTCCAFALLERQLAREIVLIGDQPKRAQGEAMDLQQAAPLGSPVRVFAGTYKDAAESAVVIVTASAPGGFTGSRFTQMTDNAALLRQIITKLKAEGFTGVIVIATNPVDVLTYLAQTEFDLPAGHVIGSGTLLDTERLRNVLSEQLNVDARSVHAAVIGEHGDSSVAVWSAAQVAGLPLSLYPGADTLPTQEELLIAVRYAGHIVVNLKGNTCFAIAACVTRICQAILRDERSVLIVSTLMTGQYGLRDVSLSTPCIVGSGGVESAIELRLNTEEQKALENSAAILKQAYAQLLTSQRS